MEDLFDVFEEEREPKGATKTTADDSSSSNTTTTTTRSNHGKGKRKAGLSDGPGNNPAASHKNRQRDTIPEVNRAADAAAILQRNVDEEAEKRERKKARKEAMAANLKGIVNSTIVNSETTKECVHEVAIPEGYTYVPMSSTPLPTVMAKTYKFVLDPFQSEAVKCIERLESVLVSAHTSAGKTVVAEYAIAKCLKNKQRVIYTSPIKALSNQKFRELQEEFTDVGLMTGDVTINPSATCLVMTTEILRSMLYRGSEIMREIGWVVFDEVHYMRDKERGVVWEETMILLPDNVHYVFLSATIPNAIQFARWICHLHHQPCHVVYTDYRPTPLQHYLFPAGGDGLHLAVDERGDFREENFMRAMASLGENPQDAKKKGRKGGTKGPSDVVRIIKLAMAKQLSPIIVFSFSKRECEEHAMALSKIDINSDDDKGMVDQVFNAAIDVLGEEDRKLPQIEHVLPLLRRGIGIHHGGLLPILKEVIEILFAEGLIKVLFATETFAMGLNMPAKTVIFTSVRKFDGKERRWVSSGEYIQMSGRAGRRGLDDRGIVILMIDEKMEPPIAKALLKGSADKLDSAFHLTYNMVLNLLRVEEINPEYMLERCFFQFQNQQAVPEMETKLKSVQGELDSIHIENEELVEGYFRIREQLEELAEQLQEIITEPKYAVPFLNSGRLVNVKDGSTDWGWGVVVNFSTKTIPRGKGLTKDVAYIVEVLLNCAVDSRSVNPSPCLSGATGELKVLPVKLDRISKFSSVRIYLPKDLRPSDARQAVQKSVAEVCRRFPDGLPILNPVKDMGIKGDDLLDVLKKIQVMEEKYFKHELHNDTETDALMELFSKKLALTEEVKVMKKSIKKSQSVLKLDELKSRKRVLRRLQFAGSSDTIELKGKVACCISTGDELVLTELLFGGVFTDLDVAQCVALCTCFVHDEKNDDPPKASDALAPALRALQDTARRIAKVYIECKIPIDEEEYVASFRTEMMSIGYAWANGAKFHEICKLTDIYEGSIVRVMRRLEELLRQLCMAAKAIGNTDLENKFATGMI